MIKTCRSFFVVIVVMLTTVLQVTTLEAATTHHVGAGQTYSKIQNAINASEDGDTVLVHDGTYVENINFNGNAITVISENGRDVTTIDGSNPADPNKGSVVTFENGEGNSSVLEGFTITGGSGTDLHGNEYTYGGGIICSNSSSPLITNCMIRGNDVTYHGGGICCKDFSSPTITNCTINDNSAFDGGGGIDCSDSSSPIISNCIISVNSVDTDAEQGTGGGIACYSNSSPTISNCFIGYNLARLGGGIYCLGSSPIIRNCAVIYNAADGAGGISCFRSSSPSITNCTISGNIAFYGGGISCSYSSSPLITNCTISDNLAENKGGGIYCMNSSSPVLINSILWGDKAVGSPNEIHLGGGSTIHITYSDINPSYITGVGIRILSDNINTDPLFVGGSDYRLTVNSPCIDKGTSSGAPADDIEGTLRPQGSGYDMGAYEYPSGYSGCPHDGDVNQEGSITPQDALMAFQHYLGIITLDDCQQDRADVNPDGIGDGAVTPADALCIFQNYLGLPSCLDQINQPLDISGSWSGSWVVTSPTECSGESGAWSVTGLSENNGQISGSFSSPFANGPLSGTFDGTSITWSVAGSAATIIFNGEISPDLNVYGSWSNGPLCPYGVTNGTFSGSKN